VERVAVPPGADERDLAELLGVEILLLRLQVVAARALLHPDLAHPLVDPRRLDDDRAFFDLQRQRLLDVDVLAGVERVDRGGEMPVIRHGDEDRVDVLGLEQPPVVGERLGGGCRLLRPLVLRAVDVAERGHVDVAELDEVGHDADAARAAADQPELHPFVGADDA
jgi:hypothetical protein